MSRPPSRTRARPTVAGSTTPSRRKRTPGRPGADQIDQRERLLDAALACFVRQGIAATSLRDIAGEAGVTPALVHYYFGDKPQLQQAVVGERLLPVVAQMRAPVMQAGDGDVAALVAGFARGIGGVVAQHPWLPTLWVREILCEGGVLRERLMDRVAPLVPLLLAQRFAAAQARGALNPELDPRLLVVSLIGLTLLPYAAAPIWRGVFANPQIGDDALINHTLALLKGGMEP